METMYYRVLQIDGDYAVLERTDGGMGGEKTVARALLPPEITEGARLRYENLEYEML